MDKPFQTYRQQIKILRKRNLSIPDGTKAIKILRRENYYNIINGYKEIFLDSATKHSGNDYYKANTSFDDIYALYSFDRNMRSILLKYILRMETSIKTKIAYNFSQNYPSNFNYFNINNFSDVNIQTTTRLIAKISNDIKNNTEIMKPGRSPSPFSYYLTKHKELPLWVLIKKLTLGETYYFYVSLKNNVQNEVLNELFNEYQHEYPPKTPISLQPNASVVLGNIINFIVEFRNICAHEERLYDHMVKHGKIPQISFFYMQHPPTFLSKTIDVLFSLGFFLLKKDYCALTKEVEQEIKTLSYELEPQITNEVLIKMGFSKNWKNDIHAPR